MGADSLSEGVRPTQERVARMNELVYQAKAGDGYKKVGMKRANSFFSTPQDAVSEALALKEKIDSRYKNEIEWEYDGSFVGSDERLRILRGYLGGNRSSGSFYLEISSMLLEDDIKVVSPRKPKNLTKEEQKLANKIKKYLAKK